ncbi:sialate O-acetylesterase [Thioclava sp. GXIMD4215]|uniref:sialate O-acetylesterase n=1 Tax=Thioclava sp. GXIMD4215 TaxID=3131928 RepID=UPI003253E24C
MIGIGSGFMSGGAGVSLRRNGDGTVTVGGAGLGFRWSVDGGGSWTEETTLPLTLPVAAHQEVRVVALGPPRVLLAQQVPVFLLLGQSNMVGRNLYDGLGRFPAGVRQWTRAGELALVEETSELDFDDPWLSNGEVFGPAVTFARAYMAANPREPLVLVPRAVGNTGFVDNRWNPGDDLYAATVADTNALFAAHPECVLAGVLWHQGESDAQAAAAATAYEARFDAMLAGLQSEITVMEASTPVIVGGFSSAVGSGWPYLSQIAAIHADLPNRRSYSAYVDASDLTLKTDGIHLDAASSRVLGARYAQALTRAQSHQITLVAEAEADAVAHYLFGEDNVADTDLRGANALSETPGARAQGYISTRTGDGGGLKTPLAETAQMTLCAVIRNPSSDPSTVYFGTLGSNTSLGEGFNGAGLFDNGAASALYLNQKNDAGGNTLMPLATPTPFVENGWNFVAMVLDAASMSAYLHDGTAAQFATQAIARATPTGKAIAIGSRYYTGISDAVDVAEFLVYDRALSETELEALAARSTARLAARGITIGVAQQSLPLETAATAHYLFGADNPGHSDIAGANPLLTAPASVSQSHITTMQGDNGGVETPVLDAESFTLCLALRATSGASGQGILGGSLSGPGTGNHGWGMFENGGALYFNAKTAGANDAIVAEAASPLVTEGWSFVAMTVSPTGKSYFRGSSGGAVFKSDTQTRDIATIATIGLGPLRYAGFADAYDIAEAILFQGQALDQAGLQAVYERSVARLGARGVTLG